MLEMRRRHCLCRRWMHSNLYDEIDLPRFHPAQGIIEIFNKHDVHIIETVQREISLCDQLMIAAGGAESGENDHQIGPDRSIKVQFTFTKVRPRALQP